MPDLWGQLGELWVAGGFVMPYLVGCTLILWYCMGWRVFTLRRGDRRPVATLARAALQGQDLAGKGILGDATARLAAAARENPAVSPNTLEELLGPVRAELAFGRSVIRSVVAVAPLLGLLGTVTGMIETFRSLGDMELFSQGGGIAGGIGEALLTTQMGLAVAVPGIIIGRILERRQATLEDELDQLLEWFRLAPAREAA